MCTISVVKDSRAMRSYSLMLDQQLQFDIACRFNNATLHIHGEAMGTSRCRSYSSRLTKGSHPAEAFQHLSAQHAFSIVMKHLQYIVCRLINTTSDAMSEAKSPTESLFRLQRSALGVLDFCSNRVSNICTMPSGGPLSRTSRILSERPMDCNCFNDGTRLRVT